MWIDLLLLGIIGAGVFALMVGNIYGYSHLSKRGIPHSKDTPPISIIKPLKGIDPGLHDNLKSFLDLDYPEYEVIFSVAAYSDPAVEVVESVLKGISPSRARLVISDHEIGINPKVNNMVTPYNECRHDWILMSDSYIRAEKGYLRSLAGTIRPDTGIVSAMVVGDGGVGIVGRLESYHLSTYYTRGLMITDFFGQTVALGASLFFRKVDFEKIGGLMAIRNYMAEDYVTGLKVRAIGRKIHMLHGTVTQHIERKSLKVFWQRHLRWAITQKRGEPLVFSIIPIQFCVFNMGIAGLLATRNSLPAAPFVIGIMAVWGLFDMIWLRSVKRPFHLGYWILRELIAPVIWINSVFSNTVMWRGTKLRVLKNGLLAPFDKNVDKSETPQEFKHSA